MATHNELCAGLGQLGPAASLYSEPVVLASIMECKDGFVIIYATDATARAAGQKPGIYLYEEVGETVSYYIQSGSANCIKIIDPPPMTVTPHGPAPLTAPGLPTDVETENLRGGINPTVLEAHQYGKVNLLGLGVSPSMNYENGLPVAILPTRLHVLSPAIAIPPDSALALQYIFPFVDIFWGADSLGLDPTTAAKWAESDMEVLRLGIQAGIPPKPLSENPFEAVATHIENVCDEFILLIDSPDTKEPDVQSFLEKQGNTFIVAPHNRSIHPRRAIGGNRYIPDFVVERADGDYHFVEIESPNVSIYQPKGQEPSSGFTHAVQQVEDWLRYIDENLDSVRREDGLEGLYKPSGQVVMGRESDLKQHGATRFRYRRAESHRIAFYTYDMLVSEARAYAASLRHMKNSPIRER